MTLFTVVIVTMRTMAMNIDTVSIHPVAGFSIIPIINENILAANNNLKITSSNCSII